MEVKFSIQPFTINSWFDYFFKSKIIAIGFGLNYCEYDIWNLLDLRRRDNNKKSFVIYENNDGNKTKTLKNKKEVLKCFCVDFKIQNHKDYGDFYRTILK